MKINVANLKKMLTNFEPFVFNATTENIFPECAQKEPDYFFWENGQAAIEGKARYKGQLIEVSGTIKADIHSDCSRCLEYALITINTPFCQEYQEIEPNCSQAQDNFQNEFDSDLNYFSGDKIDLRPVIRETLLLAQPLNQLCREDCLGLCPECGTNLNISNCGCANEKTDARLAVLKCLLKAEN